jgi:hypothetical protein
MNDLDQSQLLKEPPPRPALPLPDRDTTPPPSSPVGRGGFGRRLLGIGTLVLFVGALSLGVWRHYEQHQQVANTAEQQANFVPNVRVEEVAQRQGRVHVSLPGTTLAFEQANIYARASGYVLKRYVAIITNLLHFGMVVVGLDYGHAGQMTIDEITGGSPYGATTITGSDGSRRPTANELQGARYQGQKIAETAKKLLR